MGLPVREDRIQEAEAALGFRYPPALRKLLLERNGGVLPAAGDEWSLHPVWDPTDRKSMVRSANHVVRETALAWEWSGFAPGAVSVAVNGAGDHLILRPGMGTVELWDHETAEVRPVEIEGIG